MDESTVLEVSLQVPVPKKKARNASKDFTSGTFSLFQSQTNVHQCAEIAVLSGEALHFLQMTVQSVYTKFLIKRGMWYWTV